MKTTRTTTLFLLIIMLVSASAGLFNLAPARAQDDGQTDNRPPILSADTIEELRELNEVQLLSDTQAEMDYADLPVGVYGYAVNWMLDFGSLLPGFNLDSAAGGTVNMEVHKTKEGAYIAGYVSAEQRQALFSPEENSYLELMLLATPQEGYAEPVAVPVSRILNNSYRLALNSVVNDLIVELVWNSGYSMPPPEMMFSQPIVLGSSLAPILVADSVEELREINQVKRLPPELNNRSLVNIPPGSYGFSTPWSLLAHYGWAPMHIGTERGGTGVMEVHRLLDETIYVVGYTDEATLAQLLDEPEEPTAVETHLFFDPYQEYGWPVAIPATRIMSSNHRRVADVYVNDIVVRTSDTAPEPPAAPDMTEDAVSPSAEVLTSQTVFGLREMTGVEKLDTFDNRKTLATLPDGVFGFTIPWAIREAYLLDKVAMVERMTLITDPLGTSAMEVHRAADGRVYIAGYAQAEAVAQLVDETHEAGLALRLYFGQVYHEYEVPVAIPVGRIAVFSDGYQESNYHRYADLTVMPRE